MPANGRDAAAQGRLNGEPLAIIDIGSNSVRMVAYEALSRAPTTLFNEKILCGLAKGVALSGFLTPEGVSRALAALQRFRVLCETMRITDVTAIATAAVRDAGNGANFLELAESALGAKVQLLPGDREAMLAGLGVMSSIHEADGFVGDLGGGSLELVEIRQGAVEPGLTLPLGGLSLIDLSERSPKKAAKIAKDALAKIKGLDRLAGRTFYAVGGTWRALARLHMRQRQYPLDVMHNYVIPVRDAFEFARLIERVEADALTAIDSISQARRPLLAYGAAVLEEIIRRAEPKEIVISALGVREGMLYERLPAEERARDPLIVAAQAFNKLRSRAPAHGEELYAWTGALLASTHLEETANESRLRHAACLLSDVSWRAHPDYRGTQSYDLVANAAFIGADHPARAFLALAASYRYATGDRDFGQMSRALVSARQLDRARIIGAAMRVAYSVSAAMPGVLPRAPMICGKGKAILTLPKALTALNGERLQSRVKQFARLIGADGEIRAEG